MLAQFFFAGYKFAAKTAAQANSLICVFCSVVKKALTGDSKSSHLNRTRHRRKLLIKVELLPFFNS